MVFWDGSRGLPREAVLHGLMAYGIFGVLQVFQRLWCGWRKARRMQRMLKDVPATQGVGHDQPVGPGGGHAGKSCFFTRPQG